MSAYTFRIDTQQVADIIDNKYIVVLKPGSDENTLQSVISSASQGGADVKFRYNVSGFVGFSTSLTQALITTLLSLTDVAYIEADAKVSINALTTQKSTPYGLNRISHKATSGYTAEYIYDTTAGTGTCAYIVDTGIDTSHSDFGGRATMAYNAANGTANTDENGYVIQCFALASSSTPPH